MVTGTHPEDIDLFDYVEGDLPADRRAQLEVHLASCARCAEQVARVQVGRDALRESRALELPARRREAILLNLPERRRVAGRSVSLSPKRLLAVLAPVAAVAAVVVALVTSGGIDTGGNEEGAGVAAVTRGTLRQDAEGGAEAVAPAVDARGPVAAVAAELRRKGFDAHVVGNRVEVRDTTRAKVARVLRNRYTTTSAGRVKVVIVP